MKRQDLLRRVGSLEQLAFVRPVEFLEGRANGLRAWDVQNGPLRFQVFADKALDIGAVTYKGVNLTFLSKPGLQGRNHYDTRGGEAQRSIMGGLFFTAGLENICAPCVIDGKEYPMHGRIRTTPAQMLGASACWQEHQAGQESSAMTHECEDGEYVMRVTGESREAELFGENMVLRRSIETRYGKNIITVEDEIENQSFRDEPLLLLYHINLGYPFMDEGTEILLNTRGVTARDEPGAIERPRWSVMGAPVDNLPEDVFIHDPVPELDAKGDKIMTVTVLNKKLSLGLKLTYSADSLPKFMEWKSCASGDYVLGLEPTNASVYGRAYYTGKPEEQRILKPFEVERTKLVFEIFDLANA